MSEPLVLAIDQGTTNTKALIVGTDGFVRALHTERVAIEFPRPGWAQSDPREIWRSVERVVAACLDDVARGSVLAIGIANQRESVVAWERATGEPLGPLVSWQCTRGVDLCAQLATPEAIELVRARTGLTLDPMFSASKMRWLLGHIDNGLCRAANGEICLGTVDSWLLWNLTGDTFTTDMTNASRTLLFDLATGDWSGDLLELFGIPRAALATILASADDYGSVSYPSIAASGATITAMIGDSHAALVGHGAFHPGAVKASFGTGTSVMAPVDRVLRSGRLSSTVGWSRRVGATSQVVQAIEGNIYATGAALEWTANLLGLEGDVTALEALARSCPDGAGVSFVPALARLGAPHWDPDARGTVTGLTRHAGPPQVARAAFEAVAHQVADVCDEIERVLGNRPEALFTDGGAIRSELLATTVADLVGVPLLRSDEPELAALGAASLAGLQAGVLPSVDALQELPRAFTRVDPTLAAERRRDARGQWDAALQRTLTTHH